MEGAGGEKLGRRRRMGVSSFGGIGALVLSAYPPISTLSCFQLSVVGLANTPAAMWKLAKPALMACRLFRAAL